MAAGLKLWITTLFYILVSVDLFSFSVSTKPAYKLFSTKTPYEWAHPPSQPVTDELYYLKGVQGQTCTARYVSAVIRHGTRYPSLHDVTGISDLHSRLVPVMRPNVNPDLYSWINRFPENDEPALAPLGEIEQTRLGERTVTRLSTLFADIDQNNINSRLKFFVTSVNRTKQSAAAFYGGFTRAISGGRNTSNSVDVEVDDQRLRFYDICDKYVSDVENSQTTMKEYNDFLSSDRVLRIKEKIERKLNISSTVLTAADVEQIYTLCGYDAAFYGSSPWCSLLDRCDMKAVEYAEDLEQYYKNGYGYNITWQQSCVLVSEIFASLDEIIMNHQNANESSNLPVGRLAFCHAETVLPLLTALGLHKDSLPLRADNYGQQCKRLFRTSKIMPFAGNVFFVLYKCEPGQSGDDKTNYYIKMFVNEEPTMIPGCQQLDCPYSVVRDHYRDFIDQCDFQKLCQQPASTGQSATTGQPASTGQPAATGQPASTGQPAATGQP